jgi:hypothetical protein
MPSIYGEYLEGYGRGWHRPWLVFISLLSCFWMAHWAMQIRIETGPFVCQAVSGSRYRGSIEIEGLFWTADLEAGLACAHRHGRRVLVAFHGLLDTNARLNEVTAFREPPVQLALRQYVLVKLYVDYVPEEFYQQKPSQQERRRDGEANGQFEAQHFHTLQEPMYVVLEPKRNAPFVIIGRYEVGLLTDPWQFVRFLRAPHLRPQEDRFRKILNKLQGVERAP